LFELVFLKSQISPTGHGFCTVSMCKKDNRHQERFNLGRSPFRTTRNLTSPGWLNNKPKRKDQVSRLFDRGRSARSVSMTLACVCMLAHDPCSIRFDKSSPLMSRISVVRVGSALSTASIQAVAECYISRTGAAVTEAEHRGYSDALDLAVRFDKTEARVGEVLCCSIDAERIGIRGVGHDDCRNRPATRLRRRPRALDEVVSRLDRVALQRSPRPCRALATVAAK
jgi:hypothetical protein